MATNRLSSSPTTVTVTSPSSGLPAWLPGPGQYANASTATPRNSPVNTGPGPWNGSFDFAAIWAVWNGGAYAPTLGAYGSMLFFGGGHFSYHGNEVVRLDLETRSWSQHSQRSTRIVDTRQSGDNDSTNVAVNEYGEWGDGTPYPPHTNMAVEFLPPDAGGGALGSFVFFGHDQTGIRVTVKGHLWKLDLATRNWARIPLSSANWVKDDIMACAYDPNRKGLWLHGRVGATSGPYYFIDTRNGNAVHEVYQAGLGGNSFEVGTYPNLTYDPVRDILVEVIRKGAEGTTANENILVTSLAGWSTSSNTARQSIVVSTANGNVTGTACPSLWGGQTTGEAWQRYAAFDKLEYCQYDSCFYALNLYTTGACQLYKLTPPANPMSGTWAWSMETLTAKNGEALAIRSLPYRETHDARLFGKMRYVPPLKCFVLSDSAEKPAQALRSSSFR